MTKMFTIYAVAIGEIFSDLLMTDRTSEAEVRTFRSFDDAKETARTLTLNLMKARGFNDGVSATPVKVHVQATWRVPKWADGTKTKKGK